MTVRPAKPAPAEPGFTPQPQGRPAQPQGTSAQPLGASAQPQGFLPEATVKATPAKAAPSGSAPGGSVAGGTAQASTPRAPSFTPAASAAAPAPAARADEDEPGSWFGSTTRTPVHEPERDAAEPFFQERRVPGQSLQSGAQQDESPGRSPRFEPAGLRDEPPGFRDEPAADFDEPSAATMRTRRGQPRFGEADDIGRQPFAERARPSDQPPITQVPGFGGDARGSRAREDFGERTRSEQPSPRFYEDTDPDERTRLSQPRFAEPDGFGSGRRFADSPRFDDEVDDRTVQRQDLGAGPGLAGGSSTAKLSTPFGGDSGFGDRDLGAPRGFDSTRGHGGARTFDGPAGFGAASAAPAAGAHAGGASAAETSADSEWTFRDTGPDTGAFQGSYGGNGSSFGNSGFGSSGFGNSGTGNRGGAGNGGYQAAFRDQGGPGQADYRGSSLNGPGAPGPYAANDRGYGADRPFGQGGQPGYPGQGSQPAQRKRSRKAPVLIGAGVLVVALGAGGAVIAPKLLKHSDPGCTAYTSSALPAYNHAISDLNAQASQATLKTDLTAAIGQLTTASGQASGAQVKSALQSLLTQLKEVQSDVKNGAVPDTTVASLNAASTAADNAC
jgi:hypothetical protein